MDKYYIPQHLDDPLRIIIFTIDEAVIFLFCFIVGFFSGFEVMSVFVSAAILGFYKYLKGDDLVAMKKALYWSGFDAFLNVKNVRILKG